MKTPRSESRVGRRGFTLIELLVVVAIIALLMAILMPALNRVKKLARGVACQSSLRQWNLIWSMYTSDNEGFFPRESGGESQSGGGRWPVLIRDNYSNNYKMRLCPTAVKCLSDGGLTPFAAWGRFSDGTFGSYGLNEWVANSSDNYNNTQSNYFKTVNYKPATDVPVFMDCYWYDVWAFDVDVPPPYDGPLGAVDLAGHNEMRRVCLNRHNAAINVAFLDWSIRKIGLKELWTLKWHRNFNRAGRWTKAGGALPSDWPEWMRDFRDY